MHDPQLDDDFEAEANCPNGHTGMVRFLFNHGSRANPVGECETCEVRFDYEPPDYEDRRIRVLLDGEVILL